MITVYFKPDCSKCISTSCLLEEQQVHFTKVEYLNTPPSKDELTSLIKKLGISAEELVRKGESVYMEKYEGKLHSEEEYINAILQDPILMERPIVVDGDNAIICRPPEKLLEFLKNK